MPKSYSAPPAMTIDESKSYSAIFKTNHGDINIDLFASQAPVTVNNFVFLARDGFYNDVIFHRVIPDFMIQGGDPDGTGMGGPGYRFQDEFEPSLVFDGPGILAMANAGPGTNGSQFFITVAPTPHLNGAHTIFGKVTSGQDIADAISKVPQGANNRPTDQVTIERIEIQES
jgi:cyclophilin family peptidyl-prolyl cis-trans isomerase